MIQQIVLTPSPLPQESFFGYLIRITEANCYRSATVILKYAGMSDREIGSSAFQIEQIAKVLNKKEIEIQRIIPWTSQIQKNTNPLLEGQSLHRKHLEFGNTKVCPFCIKESGFHDSFFHLKCIVACFKHKCVLVTHCPSCKKELSWKRSALLKCKCGSNLSSINIRGFHHEPTHALHELLYCKLHNLPVNEDRLYQLGFPVGEIKRTSLPNLLHLITKLEKITLMIQSSNSKKARRLKNTCIALEDWPKGFFGLLSKIKSYDMRKKLVQYYKIRKNYKEFHFYLFNQEPNEKISAASAKKYDIFSIPFIARVSKWYRKDIKRPYSY